MFSCVNLNFTTALNNEGRLLQKLQCELSNGLGELEHGEDNLARAVYVIRMTGAFLIAYKKRNSPVLYVGRGNCTQRLASHLKNWMSEVHGFGVNVGVEIRVACPRRQNRPDFYKNVEADLLARFARKHGSLPFFNRRYEVQYAGKVHYSNESGTNLDRAIGIGSGQRPRWALTPTRANKAFASFTKG